MRSGTASRRTLWLTAAAGLVLTALVTLVAMRADAARDTARDDETRAQAVGALQLRAQALEDRLDDVVGLFVASRSVSQREYGVFTGPMVTSGDVRSITLMESVPPRLRAAFQREVGAPIRRALPDGTLVPADADTWAFAVRYQSLSIGSATLLGFDGAADAVRGEAIRRTVANGRPAATAATTLASRTMRGFILYAAIPGRGGTFGKLNVRGVVAASLGFDDLRGAIERAVPPGTAATLTVAGKDVLRIGDRRAGGAVTAFMVGGQRWAVRTRAAAASGVGLAPVSLAAGLLLTLLAVALVRSRRTRRLLAARDDARERAETRFSGAFASAPIGYAIVRPDGEIVRINEAYCRILGRPEREALATNALDLVHEPDRPAASDQFLHAMRSPGVAIRCEARAVTTRGPRWMESHATFLPDDGVVLIQAVDVDDRRRFEEQLRHQAEHDPLTDLLNRRGLNRVLAAHLERRPRGAVLLLDLDHFKTVNDLHGHRVGDQVLEGVANVLRETVRDHDTVARLGGDEFAVLLPDVDAERAQAAAGRLVDAICAEAQLAALGGGHGVPASVGVAMIDASMTTPEEALTAADLAMYDAKDAGRGRFALYDSAAGAPSATRDRLVWVERVRAALNDRRLRLAAQPIRDVRTGTVAHYELLLRLVEHDGSEIMPGEFLPIAEQFGLIEEIDQVVARSAIGLLHDHPDADVMFHVNLSGRSMGNADLLTTIRAELARTGVDPGRLVFEITETAAVTNLEEARAFAEHLADLGSRLALDDFGAGFGSFAYLKQLPFDMLKIDGQFVRHCAGSPTDRVILESLVHAARGLDKQTVAEFVEDAQTEDLLNALGVDFVQGYHIGRPVPVEDVLSKLPGSSETTRR